MRPKKLVYVCDCLPEMLKKNYFIYYYFHAKNKSKKVYEPSLCKKRNPKYSRNFPSSKIKNSFTGIVYPLTIGKKTPL